MRALVGSYVPEHYGFSGSYLPRQRFFEQRLAGLEDRLRRGRPPAFPPQVRAEVMRPACERPADSDVPLARWSSAELAAEVVARVICEQLSGVTVRRWLSEDAIKPMAEPDPRPHPTSQST